MIKKVGRGGDRTFTAATIDWRAPAAALVTASDVGWLYAKVLIDRSEYRSMTDGSTDRPLDHVREEPTATTTLLILGLGLLALFAGLPWFWMIFAFGFGVVVPLVAVLYEDWDGDWFDEGDRSDDSNAEGTSEKHHDSLTTLRDRYARGDLTDEQFERKLERLLETETLDDIEQYRRERLYERERT